MHVTLPYILSYCSVLNSLQQLLEIVQQWNVNSVLCCLQIFTSLTVLKVTAHSFVTKFMSVKVLLSIFIRYGVHILKVVCAVLL